MNKTRISLAPETHQEPFDSNSNQDFSYPEKVAFHIFQGWELKEPVQYKFKEFPYYETRKNEALFREYVKACEQVMEAI